MNSIKSISLVGLAMLVAMACVGVSSASAEESTALCRAPENPCNASPVEVVHFVNEGVIILLTNIVNILCLQASITLKVLGLNAPQQIHTEAMSYSACGTSASHNNCIVTVIEGPLFELLRTGSNEGVLEVLSGEVRKKCTIFGFIKLDCTYQLKGSLTLKGADFGTRGHLTADKLTLTLLEGEGGLCPTEVVADELLEALQAVYVRS